MAAGPLSDMGSSSHVFSFSDSSGDGSYDRRKSFMGGAAFGRLASREKSMKLFLGLFLASGWAFADEIDCSMIKLTGILVNKAGESCSLPAPSPSPCYAEINWDGHPRRFPFNALSSGKVDSMTVSQECHPLDL